MALEALFEEPVIHINAADPPVSGTATMAKLTNGNLLLAWISSALDYGTDAGSTHNYHAQIYAPDGTPLGEEFVLNNQVAGYQSGLQLVALAGGGFAASWSTEATGGQSSNPIDVHARVFLNDGTPLANEFAVNTANLARDQYAASMTATADGGFSVFYYNFGTSNLDPASGLRMVTYSSSGSPAGSDLVLQGPQARATSLGNGTFLLTWAEPTANNYDVKGRLYTDAGAAIGATFTVNQQTANQESQPSVSVLADGRFVITWTEAVVFNNIGTDDIRGRIFNADGTAWGDQFNVNTVAAGGQNTNVVTALSDGGFVVTWVDSSPQTVLGDFLYWISGQRFDAAGNKVDGQFGFEVPTYFIQGHALTTLDDGRLALTWTPTLFDMPAGGGAGTLTDASAYLRFIDFAEGNSAPVITWEGGGASANIQLAEDLPSLDGPFVYQHDFGRISVSDPNGDRLAFSLSGEDAALFTLDPISGRLMLNQRVNFENPDDSNHDGVYRVTVTVSDGTSTDLQDIAITVTNVVDGLMLTGNARGNALTGTDKEDSLSGLGGNDTLRGLTGDDQIDGGSGNDTITGGDGADQLIGGLGRDTFVYSALNDSYLGLLDTIADFSRAQGDRISLSAIDANAGRARDQSFSFIGEAEFGQVAGQLRFYYADGGTYVAGDVDGDGVGDFLIRLDGTFQLASSDFML